MSDKNWSLPEKGPRLSPFMGGGAREPVEEARPTRPLEPTAP